MFGQTVFVIKYDMVSWETDKNTWIYQREDVHTNFSGRECILAQMCCTYRNCNIAQMLFWLFAIKLNGHM